MKGLDEYTLDEIQGLSAEVQRQGGAHLPDRCVGVSVKYKPPKKPAFTFNTCRCGNETIFVTVYEPGTKDEKERGGGFARVCAVCDGLGRWPRFAGVIE